MIKTKIGGEIAMIVGQTLREYSDDVSKACYVCTEETLQDMVDDLKKVNVGKTTGKPWKKFPKAWKYELKQMSWGECRGTVHLKKPMYRIGHLLEYDHASRKGGRTVAGNNFIAPIAEEYEKKYEEKMKQMIGVVG